MNKIKLWNDKCEDCKKEFIIFDLVQVRDKYPLDPKYKWVCNNCFEKGKYYFVGKWDGENIKNNRK